MKAAKGNREYSIDEKQKKSYQDMGFDIFSDDGTQIAWGKGKTVPFEDYEALEKENAELKAENDLLKAEKETVDKTEVEEPKKKAGK